MNRLVEPELLDELPAHDPSALSSRRDLQRINLLMRHPNILAHWIRRVRWNDEKKCIVDLGAGDGFVALKLAQQLGPAWNRAEIFLVDRQNALSPANAAQFRNIGWQVRVVEADVMEFLAKECPRADVIMANLFLHHFSEAALQGILQRAAEQTKMFLACEPRRSRLSLLGARLLWMIGCNSVTRHDAIISVQAGFFGHELSRLWPQTKRWRLRERAVGLFSHGFCADRSEEI
ncbi:MAG: methyltransferase domain-containing protein [Verrucomicrobia bacterium]|nr:methyltransferase domain-containing protein [Verrucomicrobiota bacterium]